MAWNASAEKRFNTLDAKWWAETGKQQWLTLLFLKLMFQAEEPVVHSSQRYIDQLNEVSW